MPGTAPVIVVKGLASSYEIEHLARLFLPGAQMRMAEGTRGAAVVYARAGGRRLAAGVRLAGRCVARTAPRPAQAEDVKWVLSRLLYDALREVTGIRPPWGMLTGVRPLNLVRKMLLQGGEAAAEARLLDRCDVLPGKYRMARQIVARQQPVLQSSGGRSYSLYVSIPFCPSRCDYCSFVSRTTDREGGLVAPYLDKLAEELALTAEMADANGLRLESIYVGGGTPTALDSRQLERLLLAVATHFDTAAVREYTVEAGRPDCTGAEKLALLKAYGVGRVSINPQSMDDGVLARIGRRHTAEDIRRCFAEARAAGHGCINMDVIAGLPGDSNAGFAQSMEAVLALGPENITVHALTLKRASNLVVDGRNDAAAPGVMVAHATERLAKAGYQPYYLYRQKSSPDNLENIGWALPGHFGLYNIFIMEEAHSILAVGAGAATKLVGAGGSVIKRLFNHKFPAEYIREFEQLQARKRGVNAFYARYLDSETAG
ncbi:MAG: coproporphyrinogen dehydrogenase HemZ [Ruminococcaceae bacterium]|nr:coproporphyrinogen dehydrogenase HemZ [Oscillospiraceae bacterium]